MLNIEVVGSSRIEGIIIKSLHYIYTTNKKIMLGN